MLQVDIAIFCLLQSNSGSCPTDGSQPVIMRRGHGSVSEMPHSCLLLERSDATARWIVQVVFHSHIFQPMQVIATIFPCIMILNLYHEPICIDCTNQSLNFEEFSSVVWHLQGSCDKPERPDPSFFWAFPDQAGLCHLQRAGPDNAELRQKPDPDRPIVASRARPAVLRYRGLSLIYETAWRVRKVERWLNGCWGLGVAWENGWVSRLNPPHMQIKFTRI